MTLIAALFLVIVGCHSEDKKPAESKTASAESPATAPYTATYSSKFEMGDNKHAEAILGAWKAWDDGDLKPSRKYFADTMHFYMRDGSEAHGATDSVMVGAQAYRSSFSSVKSTVHAYLPLKSTDKNENWVCVWGTEVTTDKQGKTDSVGLQETWRFNKDGKIDLLYQFGRALVPPPATK
jgi:hypothetical protein